MGTIFLSVLLRIPLVFATILVPILLRESAIFRCPLCAQLLLCLCFPKVVIFDFHFSTMDDDFYGQVESKSSLWYKNQTIWLKNG